MTYFSLTSRLLACAAGVALTFSAAQAEDVEVLHWWTSGGEAAAIATLKDELAAKGIGWKDFAVAGGAGSSALTVLKSRVLSGNPPTAAQMLGQDVAEWGQEGLLANFDAVAEAGNWDELLSPAMQNVAKYDGSYVAVPVNIHRSNYIWSNRKVFEDLGLTVPATWDEVFETGEKIKEAGIIPIAHGGQPWQEAMLFENILLGTEGGPEIYRKIFVERDPAAVESEVFTKALQRFRDLKLLMDPNYPGRDWNLATGMVISGEAAMQFMGDNAKGEFNAANKVVGVDYDCTPVPNTANDFLYYTDSFAVFEQSGEAAKAQAIMADTILAPKFQEEFNLRKGSIPVNKTVSLDKFDGCARNSREGFDAAEAQGTLMPSFAINMALPPAVKGELFDILTAYFNSDTVSIDETQQKFASVIGG